MLYIIYLEFEGHKRMEKEKTTMKLEKILCCFYVSTMVV